MPIFNSQKDHFKKMNLCKERLIKYNISTVGTQRSPEEKEGLIY